MNTKKVLACFNIRIRIIVSSVHSVPLQVWPDALVQCERPSPKADAASASVQAANALTTITGDPFHNVLNLQKVLPAHSPDSKNFETDYKAALTRLSAPEKTRSMPQADEAKPKDLDSGAHDLLQEAVMCGYKRFQNKLQANAVTAMAIRDWLGQPNVEISTTWKQVFQARPPLGTLRRLRARFGLQAGDAGDFNFSSLKDFTKELRRIRRWYGKPRRHWRYKRGILRKVKGHSCFHLHSC